VTEVKFLRKKKRDRPNWKREGGEGIIRRRTRPSRKINKRREKRRSLMGGGVEAVIGRADSSPYTGRKSKENWGATVRRTFEVRKSYEKKNPSRYSKSEEKGGPHSRLAGQGGG